MFSAVAFDQTLPLLTVPSPTHTSTIPSTRILNSTASSCSWSNAAKTRVPTTAPSTINTRTRGTSERPHSPKGRCRKASRSWKSPRTSPQPTPAHMTTKSFGGRAGSEASWCQYILLRTRYPRSSTLLAYPSFRACQRSFSIPTQSLE